MTENVKAAKAKLGRGGRFSRIWLVPIAAIVIGFWMAYLHWAKQGPLIEITFVSGEGIEAGKTKVKRKNVDIGEVLELRLAEDAESVVLSVRMNKPETHLLREDSKFWVVRPRIGTGGISGLNTLLSGAYIELSPGSGEETETKFVGLETPPVTPIGTPGLHVTLDSDGNKPLNEGDPVLFHGIEVGTIEFVHFNTEERRTYYNAFVAAPYDQLITTNTRFWFSSGINADLSADGIRLEMTSLATVISGGVSFDVPDGQPKGEQIRERAFFNIYPRESAINEKHYENALTYAVLFDDSIRGLRPGAPVEFRGVKVGQVLRTDTDYPEIENLLDPDSRIPVLIEVVPARLGFSDSETILTDVDNQIDNLVAGGLHAALATGNLLTGRKYIELQYYPDHTGHIQRFADYSVIPSIDDQLGQLLANASKTLDVINELPLSEVFDSAHDALDQMTVTLAEFGKSATELDEILKDPASHQLMRVLNSTLKSFQELAVDFSEGSATNRQLQQSLNALEQSMEELEPVLRNIRRKPNSLVFGGRDAPDLEPKGAQE